MHVFNICRRSLTLLTPHVAAIRWFDFNPNPKHAEVKNNVKPTCKIKVLPHQIILLNFLAKQKMLYALNKGFTKLTSLYLVVIVHV